MSATKAALKAAKARGVILCDPNLHLVRSTDTKAATAARIAKARVRNSELRQVIAEIKDSANNVLSLREIAATLNEAGLHHVTRR